MEIKVGKTYETRDGQRVKINSETEYSGYYRMAGRDEKGRVTWYSRKGRFDKKHSRWDLVREIIA